MSCLTICDAIDCSTPHHLLESEDVPHHPVLHHLLEFAQVHIHWIGDAIQLSHPLFSSAASAVNLSQHQGLFQWVSSSHQVTKVLELQLQHQSLHHQHSGLISLKIDWFDLIAVQGTLRSLLQHHSLKASILWHSAFFTALTTTHDHWEDHSLDIWIFVGRVMSLLFNTLSRFVIAFLPRSKHLLTSCLQSPSAVILEPKKRKSVTASTFSPSICHEVMGRLLWS